jgi:outer membrane lipoprotein-sorting protein
MVSVCAAILLATGIFPLSGWAAAPSSSPSNAETVETVERAFEQRQARTQTYQAALRQEVRMDGMRDPVISLGTLFYKKPGLLRINFTSPSQNFILIRDGKILSQTPTKRTERPLSQAGQPNGPGGMGLLLDCFQGGGARFKENYQRTLTCADKMYLIRLSALHPRRDEPSHIEVRLEQTTLEVRSLELQFAGRATLHFAFSNIRRNHLLEDSIFE